MLEPIAMFVLVVAMLTVPVLTPEHRYLVCYLVLNNRLCIDRPPVPEISLEIHVQLYPLILGLNERTDTPIF